MNYKIYPYKRGKLYRIFVVFKDEDGRTKSLSTGVTYPLRTTKKKRAQAMVCYRNTWKKTTTRISGPTVRQRPA